MPGVAELRTMCENARRVVAACELVEPTVDLDIPVAHLSDDDDEPYFWDFI